MQINTPKTQGSIANTLKFWFLIFSLIPLTIFALFSYNQANLGISHLADQQLRNTSILAARFVKNWLDYRMFDIINQAHSRNNQSMFMELNNGLKDSKLSSAEFVKSKQWNDIVKVRNHELQHFIVQYDYIANLFFVDLDGNVLYTYLPDQKLGKNLFEDDMNIELGKSIKQATELDSTQFSDKTLYEQAKNTITGFMITPMQDDNNKIIGSFVMQIRFERIINALIASTGSSLTHYLVGDDAYLRSAYKNSPGELLKQSITTEPIIQWIRLPVSQRQNMNNEVSHYKGPQGHQVIGIIHTIQIANISWALVSEIDEQEAMKSLDSIAVATIALEIVTILMVVMFAHLLISRMTKPIIKLRDAMINIASGAKNQRIEIETNDEISTLAHAFNHLLSTKKEYEQTLLENTRKIELVLDSTAAGTWDWLIQTKEISLSDQWAEIIGYDLSELGLVNIDTWMDLMHPDDHLNADIALRAHWDKKTDRYLFESRVKHKNGDWIWVQDTGQVIEWHKDGKPKRMVGTRVDINDRKHSEQELKKLSRLASESTNGVIFSNVDGSIEWINEGYTRLSGYDYDDIKDKKLIEILNSPKTDSETIAKIKSAIESADTFHLQALHYHKNGNHYWVDLLGSPLLDDAGELEGFMLIATDINDRKTAALQLARQQDMLEQMSLLGSIGAWEVDLLNNKLYWSSMTKKIHEVPSDYQPNLSSAIYFYKEGESRSLISHHIKQGIENGESWNVELPLITAKGREIWVAATGKSEMENGKSIRMFGSFQDITVHKNIENEIIKAKNTAEAATEAKNEFLATMSHEIRTPMNAVIGMLNLLCRSKLNEKQQRQIDVARSSAQSLLSIINDILDFSKVETGKMDLEIVDINLHEQMSEFVHAMALKAEEKGIELVLDLTALSKSWVKSDPGRLRQIFTNLVGNAIKFTDNGEITVTCSLEEVGDKYKFQGAVSDTGIGIPEEKRDKLFQFFTQVDTSTTRKFGGAGLGLAIVKKLCILMGGEINIDSKRERGCCFTFSVEMYKS